MSKTATHYRWDDLDREELSPLIGRRLITGEQMMIAHVYLAKGAIVPKHDHHNEQISYILQGTLRFWLGDEEGEAIDVGAGEVLTIPPHVAHRAEALEDVLDVDIFTPPREDWLSGDDAYLRGGAEGE
jgi:quercetin dioxygenase-like cupin family protein